MNWKELLENETRKEYMIKLGNFLHSEYKNEIVFPPRKKIFRAIELSPYEDIKVCILGQDPYHGPGQANGLAFAVNQGTPAPPSLRNIFQEVADDLGCDPPTDTTLIGWAKQGVLLLNTVLTVRAKTPMSHRRKGWEDLTDTIISRLNQRQDPMVFMLWGSAARSKEIWITNERHLVLRAPHPSPLSAHRGFFGCKHFSKANEWLQEHYGTMIDWERSGND